MENNPIEIIIEPKKRWFDLHLQDLWRYRDLVKLFVKRDFLLTYNQTILGPLWLVLNPLLSSVVYTFVFGGMAGISTDGLPPILFYLSGNTLWSLFSGIVLGTSKTFVNNFNLFGKIYFPRLAVPISEALTGFLKYCIQLGLLLLFYLYFVIQGMRFPLSAALLFIPVLFLQCLVLAVGCGLIITSFTTRYRDLAIAVEFGMLLWMYITPVVYPVSSTGGGMYTLLMLNPMTSIINNFRYCLLGTGQLLVWPWLVSLAVTGLVALLGLIMFNRVEKTFIDVV